MRLCTILQGAYFNEEGDIHALCIHSLAITFLRIGAPCSMILECPACDLIEIIAGAGGIILLALGRR